MLDNKIAFSVAFVADLAEVDTSLFIIGIFALYLENEIRVRWKTTKDQKKRTGAPAYASHVASVPCQPGMLGTAVSLAPLPLA